MTDKCTWCKGEGYFGDFGPGLYPLPCPHCAGIGLEGVITEDISNCILDMRENLYNIIKTETERLYIASKSFEMGVRAGLAENLDEAKKYERQRRKYIEKLNNFPVDYLPIEKFCLEKGWEQVKELVNSQHKTMIEKNSRKIVGKTYRENIIMELENCKKLEN